MQPASPQVSHGAELHPRFNTLAQARKLAFHMMQATIRMHVAFPAATVAVQGSVMPVNMLQRPGHRLLMKDADVK